MGEKVVYGTPQFILKHNKRNYRCEYIVENYGTYFSKFNDLNRQIGLKDRIINVISDERENIRQCLLHNGYEMYGEFVAEFNQKKRILNDTFKNGKYKYAGYTILNNFHYLGYRRTVYSVTGGNSHSALRRYYKHLECGGCVKEIPLENQNTDKSIFLCTKCGNCFNYNDINTAVNIILRSPRVDTEQNEDKVTLITNTDEASPLLIQ